MRQDVMRRASVVGYGFLSTYFTDLHRSMPEYPDWIANWVTSAELRDRLSRCGVVDGAFDDVCRFTRSLSRPDAPFKWFGCCFEVCVESRIRGSNQTT